MKKEIIMNKKDKSKNRLLGGTLPLLGAIFLAIGSVVYIMYKSWSNKVQKEKYEEMWRDYEECGI
ncbi:MAG: hypothetical protein ACI4J2_04765 [Ruminococcus sp.]